jgi:5-methyltetrahydrofolate--homocysteine methyltransferase
MAIASGMTSAITNPCHEEIVKAVMAADALMGHDPSCMRWLRKFREVPAAAPGGEADAARGRREGRRRRG